jgi:glucosylceramidase
VDYTIEYYTTGHLTKFVKPGAVRIDSNNTAVQNVAWRNPDGSKALIAHNGGTSAQSVRVDWSGQSFVYTLPARTTATFTWSGAATPQPAGAVTGLAGKCVDVAGAATANGTAVQLHTCNGTGAQHWARPGDGTLRALGKCLDISGPSTADGTATHLWDCHAGSSQKWAYDSVTRRLVNQYANKCLDVTGNNSADGTRLQVWTCTTGANQKWALDFQ